MPAALLAVALFALFEGAVGDVAESFFDDGFDEFQVRAAVVVVVVCHHAEERCTATSSFYSHFGGEFFGEVLQIGGDCRASCSRRELRAR